MSAKTPSTEKRSPRPRNIDGQFVELEAVMYAIKPKDGSAEDEEKFANSAEVKMAADDFARRLDELWTSSKRPTAPESDGGHDVHVQLGGMGLDQDKQQGERFEEPPAAALGMSGGDGHEVEPLEQGPGAPEELGLRPKEQVSEVGVKEAPARKEATAVKVGESNIQVRPVSSSAKPFGTVFSLANAKAGQEYLGVPKYVGKEGWTPIFRNVQLPDGLGLLFDPNNGAFGGIPLLAGEHKIPVEWSSDGAEWHTGVCSLLVNPDPKSLWKVLEPPENAPYRKPHTDGRTIDCGEFKIAVGSRRGRSHEHTGGFRDDDFWIEHDQITGWSVMIVCDGAGSAKHSRWGSKLAAETGGKLLMSELLGEGGASISKLLDNSSSLETTNEVGKEFYKIYPEMAMQCVKAIEDEAVALGASTRDYATTMLAVAIRRRGADTFLATFWMGDGAIGVYGPRGKARLMGSPDSGDFVGQTRFLDRSALLDKNVYNRINVGRYTDVIAVLAMTDGISDPSFETDSAMNDATKWDALWDSIAPSLGEEKPHDGLIRWMDFFTSGHHDDRTLAVLW